MRQQGALRKAPKDVDLGALFAAAFGTRTAQFCWFLAVALLTRISMFGDPGYHEDEQLYFLIGQRMHDGLIPYVDIWDRKGPGVFVIYWFAAAISRSVVAYQVVACLFAATTAFVANAIAEHFAGRLGAILCGSLYLIMLPLFAGGGGQAPVFYNLFIAISALIVFRRLPVLRTGVTAGAPELFAMLSAGMAMTFKQTAAIEGIFFGCAILWTLRGAGQPLRKIVPVGLGLAFAGAAPLLACAATYAWLGHFAEFWHAMVTANLTKVYNPKGDALERIAALALIATPLLLPVATAAVILARDRARRCSSVLLAGWLVSATIAFAIVPNFIDHYMLPLVLPLSVAAAPALEWRRIGPAYALFAALLALLVGPSLKFEDRQASRAAMVALKNEILVRDAHPRLFIYQGPVYLYEMVGSYPPTPLIFPMHLFNGAERNTSHLSTVDEVRKVLAGEPTIVVMARAARPLSPDQLSNPETGMLVKRYLAGCELLFTRSIIEYYGLREFDVFGRCRRPLHDKSTDMSSHKR